MFKGVKIKRRSHARQLKIVIIKDISIRLKHGPPRTYYYLEFDFAFDVLPVLFAELLLVFLPDDEFDPDLPVPDALLLLRDEEAEVDRPEELPLLPCEPDDLPDESSSP